MPDDAWRGGVAGPAAFDAALNASCAQHPIPTAYFSASTSRLFAAAALTRLPGYKPQGPTLLAMLRNRSAAAPVRVYSSRNIAPFIHTTYFNPCIHH